MRSDEPTVDSLADHRGEGPGKHEFPLQFRIGTYVLVRYIAKGGMAEVYEARRDRSNLRYALKILGPLDGAREAEILEHVQHPGVVTIHHDGTFADSRGRQRHYIVMELVRDAKSIVAFADSARLGLQDRLELFLRACRTMERFHQKACHFDLKPSNMLVDEDGFVKISDAGLARLTIDLGLDSSGGTNTYMAPEQTDTPVADLDHRADQYALGATLYELLGGLPPNIVHRAASRDELREIKRRPVSPMPRAFPEIDDQLDQIVGRALRYERRDRFGSVAEFRRALEEWRRSRISAPGRAAAVIARWWRHPLLRLATWGFVVVLISGVLSGLWLAPFVSAHLGWAERRPALSHSVAAFDRVRLVAVPPAPEMERLAAELDVQEVSSADIPSWRRLHALLCDRLAGVADTIVFDFYCAAEHAADADFAGAIVRSMNAGTPVVIASQTRTTNAEGMPAMSPVLWRSGVHWGYFTITMGSDGGPMIPLLADDGAETYPSLAMEAVASSRARIAHGTMDRVYASYALTRDDKIDISFWAPSKNRLGGRMALGGHDRITPTAVQPYVPSPDGSVRGFTPGDRIAQFRVDPPDGPTVDAATVAYADVLLRKDPDLLRNKVVVIFDPQRDQKVMVRDERISGASVHAAAIEAILGGEVLRLWGGPEHLPIMLVLGVAGVLVGRRCARSVWSVAAGDAPDQPGGPAPTPLFRPVFRTFLAFLVCFAASIALFFAFRVVSSVLASTRGILLSPIPGVCTMFAAAVIASSALIWRPRVSVHWRRQR